MPLNGTIQSAPTGLKGFDSDTQIMAQTAQSFYQQGYKFCVRYVSLGPESTGDLSNEEATGILQAGLALMPVQHVPESNWSPTGTLGKQFGSQAASNAQLVGFPAGVNVWCDLEGVGNVSPNDVIAYCQAWYEAVKSAGFVPGLYVGANPGLNGQQLYDLSFQHYWQSQSQVPVLPSRGYQLIQQYPSIKVNGISIDVDNTQTDSEGGQAQWLIQAK